MKLDQWIAAKNSKSILYKSPMIAMTPPPSAAAAMGTAVAGAKLPDEPVLAAPAPVCVAAARLESSCDTSDLTLVRAPLSLDFASPETKLECYVAQNTAVCGYLLRLPRPQ